MKLKMNKIEKELLKLIESNNEKIGSLVDVVIRINKEVDILKKKIKLGMSK